MMQLQNILIKMEILSTSFFFTTHAHISPVRSSLFTRSNCSQPSEVIILHRNTGKEESWGRFCTFLHSASVFTLYSLRRSNIAEQRFESNPVLARSTHLQSIFGGGSISPICFRSASPTLGRELKFSSTPSAAPPQTTSGLLDKLTLNVTDYHLSPIKQRKN